MERSARLQLEALFADEASSVYGYARARLPPLDAEDVTAEAFHAAVVALTDGRAHQVNGRWLMAVTKNKVIDRWRKGGRDARRHLALASQPTGSFPDDWSDAARRTDVLRALDTLPHHYRTALVMRYLDGHPVAEVAEALSLSIRAAESLLARARSAFRGVYGEEST